MSGTIAILTALNLEYDAVREKLVGLAVQRHPAGTRFEVGRLRGNGCQVALALVGKGNHAAAVLAERAIAKYEPAAVFFVGVAGSLWPSVKLGDIVVATHVYAYHGGTSEDDGLKARPRVWEASHAVDQVARHIGRTGEWTRHLLGDVPAPAVHFGPIAAGEIVQDSAVSTHAQWIRQHYNDALAVEMEAAGVAQATHLNNGLPVAIVRGISDMADGNKAATDRTCSQPRAAAHAAAFAVALASAMHTENVPTTTATRRKAGTGMEATNTNIAKDNARVGVQGTVYGNVHIGTEASATMDLATEIAALRDDLKHAHAAGHLDDSTYQAAAAELENVTEELPGRTPESRSRVMVALKRLRGLVADVAGVAERVATIMTAVRSLW